MDAGEIERFGAAGMATAPACGHSLQAGSVVPASETATPEDAPRSKSLRDKPSEHMDPEVALMICLRLKISRGVCMCRQFQTQWPLRWKIELASTKALLAGTLAQFSRAAQAIRKKGSGLV
jgi:hypothetical protein